jgi:hypothetical protein
MRTTPAGLPSAQILRLGLASSNRPAHLEAPDCRLLRGRRQPESGDRGVFAKSILGTQRQGMGDGHVQPGRTPQTPLTRPAHVVI